MRLTARTRIVGTLAVALIAAVLAPGASADYGFTHQEAARSLDTGVTPRGVAILAQQSGQGASSTTVVRPNPDQQGTQSGAAGPPVLPVARAAESLRSSGPRRNGKRRAPTVSRRALVTAARPSTGTPRSPIRLPPPHRGHSARPWV